MIKETPECKCLNCGKKMDAASGLNTEDGPSPGDITLCFKCGAVMAFADDLTLRGFTQEEADRLKTNTEYIEFLARHVQRIHFMRAMHN